MDRGKGQKGGPWDMRSLRFRRFYLDKALHETVFRGRVLDVGGKKHEKRGSFTPPLDAVDSWEYLNIDVSTQPDYLCSADTIPVADNSFDMIILTEVLEHLESPEKVLRELRRILKDNGELIASIPFLTSFHVHTGDFQRWTHMKIRTELEHAGFQVEKIDVMGGVIAVVVDLVSSHIRHSQSSFTKKVIKNLIQVISPLLLIFDKRSKYKERITTGYFFQAKKH
jgi:SAM-dependent methyltransferase